jgi:hypothetical protein
MIQTVDFGTNGNTTTEIFPFGHDFMWSPAISLADAYPKDSYYKNGKLKWMSYVPLEKKNYRLQSVTTFSLWSKFHGFESIFQSKDDPTKTVSILTGKRRPPWRNRSCVPVHFRLWENEVISHVWILREPEGYLEIGEEEYNACPLGLIVSLDLCIQ